MQKVKDFLSVVDEDTFKVMIESVRPTNEIMGTTIPDIMTWRFCDVMDLTEKNLYEVSMAVIKMFNDKADDQSILNSPANTFLSYMRFLQKQFEKVSLLMSQLKRDPDENMIEAGMDKMDRFGVLGIYYGISKNPLDWDAISEIRFSLMYTKLLMDKETAEIQERYSKAVQRKQK